MAADQRDARPVLYLVVCAAPPAREIAELVELIQRVGWSVCVIATPRAATWLDADALSRLTGYPVRSDYKGPDEPDPFPQADAIAVVPATFNTINKWASGISDTFALGVLNDALGLGLPIVVSPYAKASLAAHPAFAPHLAALTRSGVIMTEVEAIRPKMAGERFLWAAVIEVLPPPPVYDPEDDAAGPDAAV
jgi:phosphopantothenoylcysteine decarboxylase